MAGRACAPGAASDRRPIHVTSARPKQLFRHGAVYAASSLSVAALSFAILPVYVAVLGAEGLGQIEVLMAGGTALAFSIGQGLPAAWFRMRFEHRGQQRNAFESVVLAYLFGSGVVAVGLGVLVGPFITARLTPDVPFYPLWLLTIAGACAGQFGDLFAAGLQAESRSLAYAVFTFTRRGLGLLAVLGFVVGLRWGVLGKVMGDVLTAASVALGVVWMLRPQLPRATSRPLLKTALAYGLPLLPHGLAMQVVSMSDRFVLGHYIGLSAVGVYSLGYRIAGVLETINAGLGNAYRALFMQNAAEVDSATDTQAAARRANVAVRLARMELLLLTASSLGGQLLALAARELLWLARIDLQAFSGAYAVSYIVCAGLLCHAAYGVLATPVFYARHATARLPVVSGVAALVNLVACLIWVPRVGMLAAAWSTALSHATLALGAWLLGRRIWALPRPRRSWAILFAMHALVLFAGFQLDVRVADWLPRVGAKLALTVMSTTLALRVVGVSVREGIRTLLGQTAPPP